MSDVFIYFVPKDPNFVPTKGAIVKAKNFAKEFAPESDEINIRLEDKVAFFDCASNYERILCPNCHAEIDKKWWQTQMDAAYSNGGFKLSRFPTPCCSHLCTLNDLKYEWPQAFGKFALELMNPNIGEVDNQTHAHLEAILKSRLKIIYQHL